jgi:pyridoxamine 5'-phosphate oxidase
MSKSIADIRKDYTKGSLKVSDLPNSPFKSFKKWLDEAISCEVEEPTALTLSTIHEGNRPRSRVVLLKNIDEHGLVFFTNYNSQKGAEIATNPYAAMNFFWPELERQVRVEGNIEKIPSAESDEYFYSRPKESQAGAIVSDQSKQIPEDLDLEAQIHALMAQPEKLKRPEHWGGFRLVPDYFEFWQGRPSRIHDRVFYRLQDEHWSKGRLSP